MNGKVCDRTRSLINSVCYLGTYLEELKKTIKIHNSFFLTKIRKGQLLNASERRYHMSKLTR
jgi:hypothetical protein